MWAINDSCLVYSNDELSRNKTILLSKIKTTVLDDTTLVLVIAVGTYYKQDIRFLCGSWWCEQSLDTGQLSQSMFSIYLCVFLSVNDFKRYTLINVFILIVCIKFDWSTYRYIGGYGWCFVGLDMRVIVELTEFDVYPSIGIRHPSLSRGHQEQQDRAGDGHLGLISIHFYVRHLHLSCNNMKLISANVIKMQLYLFYWRFSSTDNIQYKSEIQ